MPSPRVTVALITYNRSRFLKETLETVVNQDFATEDWELLVIDNNSTDDTAAVVAAFAGHQPAPRRVLETQQGLDHGRNRAVAEARGEIVVLADDDILVEPSWLRELVAPLLSDPAGTIGVVGGEVVPVFPDGLPAWLGDAHRPMGFRKDAGPLPDGQTPMGANFAFPKRVLDRLGAFDTHLDRKGGKLFGGGDSEMIRRVRRAGLAVWFAPAAAVRHQMPAGRLTFAYATCHAFDSARSRVADRTRDLKERARSPVGFWLSRAGGSLVKLVLQLLLAAACALVLNTGAAKRALVRAWRCCGYLTQIARSAVGKL